MRVYTHVTSKCNVGCGLDNKSKAQHEVMVIIALNVATQGCYRSYKNRVSAPTGKDPCTNLHCYKISTDNNYTSILCLADIAFLDFMGILHTHETGR